MTNFVTNTKIFIEVAIVDDNYGDKLVVRSLCIWIVINLLQLICLLSTNDWT